MYQKIKKTFYFPLAHYFSFWAGIRLQIWRPKMIVVTGSSGKTTLLNLIEAQLREKARYSYKANSSFGISFDILDLHRQNLTMNEWLFLFLMAPFKTFKKSFPEKLYIVEADCDRPNEGKFLTNLLNPDTTLWLSLSRTHSANFDSLVEKKRFKTVEEAITFEFGYFAEQSKSLLIINADSDLIKSQIVRTKAKVESVSIKNLKGYLVKKEETEFKTKDQTFKIKSLLPREVFYSIVMTQILLNYLNEPFDPSFKNFYLPPGRSSVFKGIKNTTIVDSSYNATLDGMNTILDMFENYSAKTKWAVLGDMIELGKEEQEEHEKLAEKISQVNLKKLILVGPRVLKYTLPKLKSLEPELEIIQFINPKDALIYLREKISGGETILFKGARFLEGIIEHLLLNKEDVKKLCRREKIWQLRRRQWSL